MTSGADKTVREVDIVSDLSTVSAEAWDRCAGPTDPFVSHAFLLALEQSGSASAETGWLPQHIVVRGEDGERSACEFSACR